MITATWTVTDGWAAPELKPFGPISLMPTASCLQYATECFEGLKLYRGYDGKLRLFRPELNCRRFQKSAERIALPAFSESELLKLLTVLAATDGPRWLPKSAPGTFLYVRPTMIATDPSIGVQRPKEAMLMLFFNLMPAFYANPDGLKLLASEEHTVRAWPGGYGNVKLGANYGPSLKSQGEAKARGFSQILWLLPRDGGRLDVTESGASNFFVVWRTKEGKTELVTAPLDGKLILEGVTRQSLLDLVRERLQDVEVIERVFDMQEIVEAVGEGRLAEAFTAGTAFFVSPVSEIEFHGKRLEMPMAKTGRAPYATMLRDWLSDIKYGKEEHHDWAYLVQEKD